MEQALSIVKVTKEDISAITNLINTAYKGDPDGRGWTAEGEYMQGQRTTETLIAQLLDKPGTDNFKCTDATGTLTGFVSLETHPQHIYLGLLTVSPKLQAGGIGRQLLAFAEDYARANKKPAIIITVINIRQELIAWYERRGYHATGHTEEFTNRTNTPKVPMHLIEMKKEIC